MIGSYPVPPGLSAGQDNGRDRDQRLEIRSQDDGDRDGGLSDKRIVAETADLALHPVIRKNRDKENGDLVNFCHISQL